MNITFRVAFRNLFRQRRRTILLGVGIAFSMMILFVVDAFVGGISDRILNQMIVNMFGHIQINMTEKAGNTINVIRDKSEIMTTITNTFPGMDFEIRENAAIYSRVIGNGTGEIAMVLGTPPEGFGQYLKTLNIIAGDVENWINGAVENPVVIYSGKAESLGVQVGDVIRARMNTIYGQSQTARLTVTAIIQSDNQFTDMMIWGRLDDLKKIADIKPYEAQNFNVIFKNLKNPMLTLAMADKLHAAMAERVVTLNGTFANGGATASGRLNGLVTNDAAVSNFESLTGVNHAIIEKMTNGSRTILLGSQLARSLGANVGSSVSFSYDTRYLGRYNAGKFRVVGIVTATNYSELAVIPDMDLYKFYFDQYVPMITNETEAAATTPTVPQNPFAAYRAASHTQATNAALTFDDSLAHNWHLLRRTTTMQTYNDKWKVWNRAHWYGRTTDVLSMQEIAETFLSMANSIKAVTGIFVMILFFIIIIGVINTLRMTIRERTREIGTIRSIGMSRSTVRSIFVTESLMLSFFASIAGIVVGWTIAFVMSLVKFNTTGGFAMLLDGGHLHFVYSAGGTIVYVLLILLVTLLTAWIPSTKASKMSIADALRHYE